jgi:hypothetical protein
MVASECYLTVNTKKDLAKIWRCKNVVTTHKT